VGAVDTDSSGALGVDWENYNYPPCLCVVHLDLEDCDEGGPRDAVKTALIAYWAGFVMCVLNAIITIVLAAGGVDGKGVAVLYTLFNLALYGILGFYSVYHAYKGLVTGNMGLSARYMIIQGVVLVYMFLAMLTPGSSFNGYMSLKKAKESDAPVADFYYGWVIVEATLWVLNMLLVGYALYLVLVNRRAGRPSGTRSNIPSLAGI
jgi:hypothetical protein